MVGRQPDIVMWFRDFGEPLLGPAEAENLRASGQTPMITWEPHTYSLAGLAAGTYDGYLHESAAIARNWGGPLLLRLAHEMNGNWYPWGGVAAATYLAAWRHVVALFRGDGAVNVEWVWSPYVEVSGRFPVAPYFPGDHFVDYVGLDGYNWGSSRGKWQSLEEVFAETYLTVIALSHKPVILAEVSSSELGGDKAEWIRAGFMTTIPRYLPRVSAVVWFNQAEKNDWRINSSPGSLDAYRAAVNCSFYGGAGPCEGVSESAPRTRHRRRSRPKLCSFHVTRRVRRPAAAAVSYCLSQPAAVRIVIRTRGRSRLRASTVRRSRSGRNRVPLARILRRRRLRAGLYRVTIVARNRSGRSRRHSTRFRVL